MDVLSRILVAVDGSAPSDAAVRLALRLAAMRHDTVSFISVYERDALIDRCSLDPIGLGDALAAEQAECERAIAAALDEAGTAGIDAGSALVTGYAVSAIVNGAREWNATCIVVGTHGRTGFQRAFLGSCAEGVVRTSPVPVFVARAVPAAPGPLDPIVCAVDSSPAAHRAFEAAAELARERGADLHALTIVQIADHDAAAYEAKGFDPDGSMSAIYAEARALVTRLAAGTAAIGVRVTPHVLGGADVAQRIVQYAIAGGCGLIVLGTHGRGGIPRALLGSTAESVLRSATVPVLVFRDPAKAEPADVEPAQAESAASPRRAESAAGLAARELEQQRLDALERVEHLAQAIGRRFQEPVAKRLDVRHGDREMVADLVHHAAHDGSIIL